MTLNPLATPFVPKQIGKESPIINQTSFLIKNQYTNKDIENEIHNLSIWMNNLENDENEDNEDQWPTNPIVSNPKQQEEIDKNIERLAQWINDFPNNKQISTPKATRKSFPIATLLKSSQLPARREMESLQKEIEQMKKHSTEQHTTITNLKAAIKYQSFLLTKPPLLQNTGQYSITWKINNFSIALNEAKRLLPLKIANYSNQSDSSFHSPIFDTDLPTYKISLQLVPYGVGTFRGTHASLKCKLRSLEPSTTAPVWPFNSLLQVSIIDHRNPKNRWAQIIPRPAPKQITTQKQMLNVPPSRLNCDDFVPLTKLLSFTEHFLLQNTMTIEVKFNP